MSKRVSLDPSLEVLVYPTEWLIKKAAWEKDNAELIEDIARLPQATLIAHLKEAYWRLDCALELVDQLSGSLKLFMEEVIPTAEDNARISLLIENAAVFTAYEQRQKALATGRKAGAEKRKGAAKKKRETLTQAVAALFDKPDKPGWTWTNSESAEYLLKQGYPYAKVTILQTVKREAAKHRKARKEEQARKFLNR